ncbi:hypothetical protein E1180_20245 [Roseibium denhamense]|uniref:Uncharacterized protein n=1 Tax=Roseibium denhamense TaxID=76305 RepID=A0ABY1PDD0_9HYPH|nr:hypothetical protein [Roseibium denhamense]MTI07837.1 hypothetical protein [Roseibium denhamense]SMP31747.1 hypothetical protein SAMN06265374_3429 [Roseibium denhamense]
MNNGRRTRPPLDFDRGELLAALGAARETLISAQRGMRPKTGLFRAADAVIEEIDEFALVLTGARDHFHVKAHGSQRD